MADPIAVARQSVDAFNSADWDQLRASLTPGATYEEFATQRRLGVDDTVEANKEWKRAFPDAKGAIGTAFASGDDVVLEITWTGTHNGELRGPLGTVAPTGRRIEVRAVQLVRVQGDKTAEVRHYFDLMGLLQQIGALPAPAGAS